MALYATRTNFTAPAASDTIIHLKGSATIRPRLAELILGSDAAPVEQSGEYQIARTSTAGTTPVATLTVVKVDSFSPAAGTTAEGNGYTTEPTPGDLLMDIPLHQKATFRFVAYPGRELCQTPAANAGICLINIGQSAVFSLNASVIWVE